MTSPDPVWAAGKPRVVLLGPTEEKITERLMTHLSGLFHPRWGFCDGWTPGSGSTDGEVHARLSTADVAVLVVGPTTPIDVMEAVQARRPELRVLPVLARQFNVAMTPLGSIQCVPRDRPVSAYSDEDEALTKVAGEVRDMAKALQAKSASAPKPAGDWPSQAAGQHLDLLARAERNFQAGVDPLDLVREPNVASDAEAFVEAVLSAFDRSALTQVLYYGLAARLADIVAPGGLRAQAFELHQWLVRSKRLDEFVKEATSRNPGNPSLAAYARNRRPSSGPSAHDVWQATIGAGLAASRRSLLAGVGEDIIASLPVDGTVAGQLRLDIAELSQSHPVAWLTWLQNAVALSGPRREAATFRAAIAALEAHPASGGVDRNAVYDRLSRLLPAQLSAVAFRLNVPQAYLPGPTASASDHAIAVIRWAEQNGQMQRLLDAEANARNVARRQ